MKDIEYKSDNGYRGVLSGVSELSIFDADGIEVMHQNFRDIETKEELKKLVDNFPVYQQLLNK